MTNYNFDVITLPSEKEVFGFSAEEMKMVELLKKCKINGDFNGNKLSPFIKYGTFCPITDFAHVLGGCEYMVTTTPHEFGDSAVAYNSSGKRVRENSTETTGIIRPIINISEMVDVSSLEDCSEIEYGEYPQVAPSIEMQKELEMAYQTESEMLKELDESYTINSECYYSASEGFEPLELTAMMYKGKKYVRVRNNISIGCELSNGIKKDNYDKGAYIWIEVLPIQWILDKNEKKLVSKCGLVSGIPLTRDFTQRYDYGLGFHATQIYKFLSRYFLSEILQASNIKDNTMNNEDENNHSMSM